MQRMLSAEANVELQKSHRDLTEEDWLKLVRQPARFPRRPYLLMIRLICLLWR